MKRHRISILVLSILCLGVFLRLNHFDTLARFNADQVRDAKIVDAIFKGTYPLLGPKAGGTTFNLGSAFYYMEYLSGVLFGHSPAGIAFFVPLLSIASIGLFFLLFRIYFSIRITLALTTLYATSFYAIKYSRFAWNPNLIPFFIFSFLLLLHAVLNNKERTPVRQYMLYLLLGILMGIGMQLHTTLLIIMPILFVLVHAYLYRHILAQHHTKQSIQGILITVSAILLLHTSFIIDHIINNGENLSSFIHGTETKTAKNASVVQNALLESQFFLQGSTYVITGIEPEKSWIKIDKLIASKNIKEIILFVCGVSTFAFGLYLGIKQLWLYLKVSTTQAREHEQELPKKYFLMLLLTLSGLHLIFFFPIATELNVRFFIGLIFLPFLFLGCIAEYVLARAQLLSSTKQALVRSSAHILIATVFISIVLSNIYAYQKTYHLDNYTAKTSAYGGISLGEVQGIAQSIHTTKQDFSDASIYVAPFEFMRSLEYIVEKMGTEITTLSEKETPRNALLFFIVENDKASEILEKQSQQYTPIQQNRFGRFTLISFMAT